MRVHQIYIGGNIYGAGNIGDDAVLQGIIRILESVVPEATITVGTFQGQRLECLLPSLQYVDSYDMPAVIAAVKRSDYVISGGGTMIGDELGLSFPLEYNAKLISIAKLYGKKVSMLAIGANNLLCNAGVKIARTIVKLCDLITVRDEESHSVCLELGAEPHRTFTTADPAFLLQAKETPRTKKIKNNLRARGKVFGINVVNESWAHLNTYKMGIAKASEYFSSQGYLPIFFCNEVRPGTFFDFFANSQTAAFLRCEHELLEPFYYSPEEMIDILSAFEFVIGMRMHTLIFSAVAGVPFVSVSRVDKVANFMRLFDLRSSGTVDHCDSKQLIADVERILDGRKAFQRHMAKRVDRLRDEFWKNADLLRDLLDERRVFCHKANASSLRFVLSANKYYERLRRLLCGDITFTQIGRKILNIVGRRARY